LLPSQYGSPFLSATSASVSDTQVWQPNATWLRQEKHWELVDAIYGGTSYLRSGGTKWLPQEPREDDASYQRRLQGSVCPPYFKNVLHMLAGMLTRVPLKLDGVVDEILQHLYDVDQAGNDLQRFLGIFAREVLKYGHCGLLVDYPADIDGTPSPRPYWVMYKPHQILGFRTETGGNGGILTQLRLHNTFTVPYGDYGEEVAEEVRVLEPGKYRVFRKQASRGMDWVEVDNGSTTMDRIPFVTCYSEYVGVMESRPPLEEVAHLNVLAYQRASDLVNQLHLAAVPRLMIFGASAEIDEIEAGPESATTWPVDARAEFIEPGGASYDAQFRHQEQIAQQIAQLGLATILPQKATPETATAKAIDRSQGDAALQVVAQQLQDAIDSALELHSMYLGLPAGSCELSRDFLAQRLDPTEVAQLIALNLNGSITQEKLLTLLDKGGWMGDEFDLQEELQATEAQQQQRLREQEQMLQAGMNELPQ
jgi:hypothetical protein